MKIAQRMDKVTPLSALIGEAGFDSYLDFSRRTGIAELILHRIDCGLMDQIPLKHIKALARALDLSLGDFLQRIEGQISDIPEGQGEVMEKVQRQVIETLESLLLQLPTMVKVVDKKPDLPAMRLIPLLKPLYNLLSGWDIRAIAPVGAIVDYNPQEHELMTETSNKVEKVEIRYVGYRQKDKLLYRARVSPVDDEKNKLKKDS
ncbi:helix-turn-helix domain-containing protein [Cyanobacterium stanieri LEGE 03274]|uniref:Helix-turn-helix domain-containing protein n=1 Tax=Cyanobacterium stanieri LEGE 03274 TaxID=1828756 RepID=A0ABR9V3N9_9CHRO|nr:helix-turn-helix domain-containing protein [Cyanobacterium stanieri]MBE9222488.1 helix-turn-helix domain-containing protein [Cyanobacterium stanieri LEGE 03274]